MAPTLPGPVPSVAARHHWESPTAREGGDWAQARSLRAPDPDPSVSDTPSLHPVLPILQMGELSLRVEGSTGELLTALGP